MTDILETVKTLRAKCSHAVRQTGEYCMKRTIISVNYEEARILYWAMRDLVEEEEKKEKEKC